MWANYSVDKWEENNYERKQFSITSLWVWSWDISREFNSVTTATIIQKHSCRDSSQLFTTVFQDQLSYFWWSSHTKHFLVSQSSLQKPFPLWFAVRHLPRLVLVKHLSSMNLCSTLNGWTSLKGIENQKKSVELDTWGGHCFAPTQQLFKSAAQRADARALFLSGVSTMAIREPAGHPCSPQEYYSLNTL